MLLDTHVLNSTELLGTHVFNFSMLTQLKNTPFVQIGVEVKAVSIDFQSLKNPCFKCQNAMFSRALICLILT